VHVLGHIASETVKTGTQFALSLWLCRVALIAIKANQSSTFEKTGAFQDVGWGQTTSRPESSVAAAVDPSNRFARRLAQRLLQRLGHNFCLKAVRQFRTNPIHAVSKMMRARAACCMVLARKAATVPRLLNSHR
jgi:hypothetical protein